MSIEGVIKAPTARVSEMDRHCCARPPPSNNALPRTRKIATPCQGRLLSALLPALSHRVSRDRRARHVIRMRVSDITKIHMMEPIADVDLMDG